MDLPAEEIALSQHDSNHGAHNNANQLDKDHNFVVQNSPPKKRKKTTSTKSTSQPCTKRVKHLKKEAKKSRSRSSTQHAPFHLGLFLDTSKALGSELNGRASTIPGEIEAINCATSLANNINKSLVKCENVKLSNDELVDTLSEMETQIQELGRTGDRLLMYSEVHEAYLKVCHASSLLELELYGKATTLFETATAFASIDNRIARRIFLLLGEGLEESSKNKGSKTESQTKTSKGDARHKSTTQYYSAQDQRILQCKYQSQPQTEDFLAAEALMDSASKSLFAQDMTFFPRMTSQSQTSTHSGLNQDQELDKTSVTLIDDTSDHQRVSPPSEISSQPSIQQYRLTEMLVSPLRKIQKANSTP